MGLVSWVAFPHLHGCTAHVGLPPLQTSDHGICGTCDLALRWVWWHRCIGLDWWWDVTFVWWAFLWWGTGLPCSWGIELVTHFVEASTEDGLAWTDHLFVRARHDDRWASSWWQLALYIEPILSMSHIGDPPVKILIQWIIPHTYLDCHLQTFLPISLSLLLNLILQPLQLLSQLTLRSTILLAERLNTHSHSFLRLHLIESKSQMYLPLLVTQHLQSVKSLGEITIHGSEDSDVMISDWITVLALSTQSWQWLLASFEHVRWVEIDSLLINIAQWSWLAVISCGSALHHHSDVTLIARYSHWVECSWLLGRWQLLSSHDLLITMHHWFIVRRGGELLSHLSCLGPELDRVTVHELDRAALLDLWYTSEVGCKWHFLWFITSVIAVHRVTLISAVVMGSAWNQIFVWLLQFWTSLRSCWHFRALVIRQWWSSLVRCEHLAVLFQCFQFSIDSITFFIILQERHTTEIILVASTRWSMSWTRSKRVIALGQLVWLLLSWVIDARRLTAWFLLVYLVDQTWDSFRSWLYGWLTQPSFTWVQHSVCFQIVEALLHFLDQSRGE